MKEINADEFKFITGASAESYRMAVNLEIANILMSKIKQQCNMNDFADSVFKSAVISGAVGETSAGVVIPGVGTIPGWAVGAASGAGMAAFTYGMTCWW